MKLNKDTMISILDSIYDNALLGLPSSESVFELAHSYMKEHHHDPVKACEALVKWQATKCGATGFITGMGGIISMPLMIPVDLAANYYIQMRMIGAIAHINGYDVRSDQVRSLIYASLVGEKIKDVLKDVGIILGQRMTAKFIRSLSDETIKKINQKVGFKLVAKFGERGVVNLSRIIPVVGGIVGGGMDAYYCDKVGDVAIGIFSKNKDEDAA